MAVTKAKGFTLIEVLIAMAIFALLGMASFNIFNAVTNGDSIAKERSKQINDIQRAMLVIERDFLQMARRSIRLEGDEPQKGFMHTDNSQFQEDVNNLAFTRNGWRNPGLVIPRSDVQAVAYYWDEESEALMRSHFNFVDAITNEDAKKRALLSKVNSVKFEFFDGDKWIKTPNDNEIPPAIAIIIEHADMGEIRRQFLLPGGVI